jgi:hypothetical protein
MSTLRTINVIHPSSATNNIVNDASGNVAIGNNLTVAGTVAMGSSFKRNRIINGNMQIWQRATTATGNYSGGYAYVSVDRWAIYSPNASTTFGQSTSVPAGFQYSIKMQRPASSTATGVLGSIQAIESVNCYDLSSQSVTVSFYAKAGANYSGGNLNIVVPTGTVADQGIATVSSWTGYAAPISTSTAITTTWTRYTFTGTFGAGVLEAAIQFSYTPTGTAGADDAVYITGVQLEVGTVATPYEMQIYSDQLAQCQRYYYQGFLLAGIWGGTAIQALLSTPVPMRTTPTTGITGTGYLQMGDTVNAGVTQSVAGWGITSPAAQNLSANYQTFQWAAGNFAGLTSYRMYYQSDYTGGTNNLITLSAEL